MEENSTSCQKQSKSRQWSVKFS